MITIITNEQVQAALEAFYEQPKGHLFQSVEQGCMRSVLEAALRSQGKVVEVSKLRDLAHWWGKNIERMQGRVNPHEIAGLTRCHKELTAIIGEGD